MSLLRSTGIVLKVLFFAEILSFRLLCGLIVISQELTLMITYM